MVRIIVDSGSDLLPEVAKERGIEVLPLLANVDGTEYRDGIDLGRDAFYELLEETGIFPKTSQVSPHTFAEAFREAREAGDEVIALTLSSALSGTYQSAKLAQAMVGHLRNRFPFRYLRDCACCRVCLRITRRRAFNEADRL